jgi:hypothetical protein
LIGLIAPNDEFGTMNRPMPAPRIGTRPARMRRGDAKGGR